MVTNEMQLTKCRDNQKAWLDLTMGTSQWGRTKQHTANGFRDKVENSSSHNRLSVANRDLSGECSDGEGVHISDDCADNGRESCMRTELFGSILDALHWITQGKDASLPQVIMNVPSVGLLREADHLQVLCTGSLHLVGGVLALLEPDISDK